MGIKKQISVKFPNNQMMSNDETFFLTKETSSTSKTLSDLLREGWCMAQTIECNQKIYIFEKEESDNVTNELLKEVVKLLTFLNNDSEDDCKS